MAEEFEISFQNAILSAGQFDTALRDAIKASDDLSKKAKSIAPEYVSMMEAAERAIQDTAGQLNKLGRETQDLSTTVREQANKVSASFSQMYADANKYQLMLAQVRDKNSSMGATMRQIASDKSAVSYYLNLSTAWQEATQKATLLSQQLEIQKSKVGESNAVTSARISNLKAEQQQTTNLQGSLSLLQSKYAGSNAEVSRAIDVQNAVNTGYKNANTFATDLSNTIEQMRRTRESLTTTSGKELANLKVNNQALEHAVTQHSRWNYEKQKAVDTSNFLGTQLGKETAELRASNSIILSSASHRMKLANAELLQAERAEQSRKALQLQNTEAGKRIAVDNARTSGLVSLQQQTTNLSTEEALLANRYAGTNEAVANSIDILKAKNEGRKQETTFTQRLVNAQGEELRISQALDTSLGKSVAQQKVSNQAKTEAVTVDQRFALSLQRVQEQMQILDTVEGRGLETDKVKLQLRKREIADNVRLQTENEKLTNTINGNQTALEKENQELKAVIAQKERAAKAALEQAEAARQAAASYSALKAGTTTQETAQKGLNEEIIKAEKVLASLTAQSKLLNTQYGSRRAQLEAEIKKQKEYNRLLTMSKAELLGFSGAAKTFNTHFNAGAQSGAVMRATLAGLRSSIGMYTSSTILAATATYGFVTALRSTLEVGTEFHATMSRVEAVATGGMGVKEAASTMQRLESVVRDMGRTTVFTATEAAQGMSELAMAGLDANDAMEALKPSLDLALIGNVSLAESSDIATNMMSAFGFSATELSSVVDILAQAVTSSNTNLSQLTNALSYVGPAAEAAGYSFKDVTAAVELLSSSGIKASRAGTAMRRLIVSLVNPTEKGAEVLRQYGISMQDNEGRARDLSEVLADLANSNLSLADIQDLVGVRAASAVSALVQQIDKYKELREELEYAGGAAERMSKTIQDNLSSDIKLLKSMFQEVQLSGFETQMERIRDVVVTTSNFLGKLDLPDLEEGALQNLSGSNIEDFYDAVSGLDTRLELLIVRVEEFIELGATLAVVYGGVKILGAFTGSVAALGNTLQGAAVRLKAFNELMARSKATTSGVTWAQAYGVTVADATKKTSKLEAAAVSTSSKVAGLLPAVGTWASRIATGLGGFLTVAGLAYSAYEILNFALKDSKDSLAEHREEVEKSKDAYKLAAEEAKKLAFYKEFAGVKEAIGKTSEALEEVTSDLSALREINSEAFSPDELRLYERTVKETEASLDALAKKLEELESKKEGLKVSGFDGSDAKAAKDALTELVAARKNYNDLMLRMELGDTSVGGELARSAAALAEAEKAVEGLRVSFAEVEESGTSMADALQAASDHFNSTEVAAYENSIASLEDQLVQARKEALEAGYAFKMLDLDSVGQDTAVLAFTRWREAELEVTKKQKAYDEERLSLEKQFLELRKQHQGMKGVQSEAQTYEQLKSVISAINPELETLIKVRESGVGLSQEEAARLNELYALYLQLKGGIDSITESREKANESLQKTLELQSFESLTQEGQLQALIKQREELRASMESLRSAGTAEGASTEDIKAYDDALKKESQLTDRIKKRKQAQSEILGEIAELESRIANIGQGEPSVDVLRSKYEQARVAADEFRLQAEIAGKVSLENSEDYKEALEAEATAKQKLNEKLQENAEKLQEISKKKKEYSNGLANDLKWAELELKAYQEGAEALAEYNKLKFIEQQLNAARNAGYKEEELDYFRTMAAQLWETNQSIEELQNKAKPFADAWSQAMERVDESFAKAWEGAYDSFSSFADSIKDSFKKMLAEMAHLAITKPILIQMGFGGAGTGGWLDYLTGGSGGVGGSGGSGGGFDLSSLSTINGIKNLFTSGVAGAVGTLGSLGTSVLLGGYSAASAAGMTGLANILGNTSLSMYSQGYGISQGLGLSGTGSPGFYSGVGMLATAGAGYAGGYAGNAVGEGLTGKVAESNWGQVAGGTIGAVAGAQMGATYGGVWGAAIGAFVGALADVFGGGDGKKRVQVGVSTNPDPRMKYVEGIEQAESGLSLAAINIRGGQAGEDTSLEFVDYFKQIDSTLLDVFDVLLGATPDFTGVEIGMHGSESKGSQYDGYFGSHGFNKVNVDQLQEAPDEFVRDWIEAANEQLGTDLDLTPIFDLGEYEELLADTLMRVGNQFAAFNEMLVLAGEEALDLDIDNIIATDGLTKAFGGINEMISGVQSYYDNFYSEEEKFKNFSSTVTNLFDELNFKLPETRDQLNDVIRSLDWRDEADQKTIANIVNLLPVLESYYGYLEQQQEKFKELQGSVDDARFSWMGDEDQLRFLNKEVHNQNNENGFKGNYRVTTFDELKAALDSLGTIDSESKAELAESYLEFVPIFESIQDITDRQTEASKQLGDEIDNVTYGWMTEAEQLRFLKGQLEDINHQHGRYGAAMIDSKEEMVAFLNSLDLTTEKGRDLAELALEFVPVIDNIETLTDKIGDLGDAITITDGQLDKSLSELKGFVNSHISDLREDHQALVGGYKDEISGIQEKTSEALEGYNDRLEPLNERVDDLSSILSDVDSALDSLSSSQDSSLKKQKQAIEYIRQTAASGTVADAEQLSTSINVFSSNDSRSYGSEFDYRRDQAIARSSLQSIKDFSEVELTNAELTVKNLEDFIEQTEKDAEDQIEALEDLIDAADDRFELESGYYEDIIDRAEDQIEILKGVDNGIQSIEDALKFLEDMVMDSAPERFKDSADKFLEDGIFTDDEAQRLYQLAETGNMTTDQVANLTGLTPEHITEWLDSVGLSLTGDSVASPDAPPPVGGNVEKTPEDIFSDFADTLLADGKLSETEKWQAYHHASEAGLSESQFSNKIDTDLFNIAEWLDSNNQSLVGTVDRRITEHTAWAQSLLEGGISDDEAQQIYDVAINNDYTTKDIAKVLGIPHDDVLTWLDSKGLPHFENGGAHTGGWRVVGEVGPELENTGPSRVHSNKELKDMVGTDQLVSELRRLNSLVKNIGVNEIKTLNKMLSLFKRWEATGLPEERVV